MLSYRHAFHAGNHGDVLKHICLIATLQHLTEKDSGITVIDTHAGAGLYRLDGDMARKSGEAVEGVFKLLDIEKKAVKPPPASVSIAQSATKNVASSTVLPTSSIITTYLAAVRSFNKSADLAVYPGSPLLAHQLLREGIDRLKLYELHPSDYPSLAGHVKQLGAGRMVTVDCANGFDKMKTLLPPPAPAKRALVLIDPSYELKSDYAAVFSTVKDALTRFPTGCFMVWYPVIPRPEAHSLPKKLKTLATQAKRSVLNVTLNIGQEPLVRAPGERLVSSDKRHSGLRESGVLIINPPHTLKAALQVAMPQLVQALGRGRGNGYLID